MRKTIFNLERFSGIVAMVLVLILAASSVLFHYRVATTTPGRADVYFAWTDGVRLANGENPYSRIHEGDMRNNTGNYATYTPSFYVFTAFLYRLGVTEYESMLVVWRPICELSHFLMAVLLLGVGWRRGNILFGCLAACFWFYNRWTLAVVNIAHLDTLALLLWTSSLLLLSNARTRSVSHLLFGCSLAVKQMALFAIPIYVIWEFREGTRSTAVRRSLQCLGLVLMIPFLVSFPFLVTDPLGYIKSILFSGTRLACGDFSSKSIDAAVGLTGILARVPMLGLLTLLYGVSCTRSVGKFSTALMMMAIILDFNSVLYFQYMIWAVPLLPLALLETRLPIDVSRESSPHDNIVPLSAGSGDAAPRPVAGGVVAGSAS